VNSRTGDVRGAGIWPVLSDDGLAGAWPVRRWLRPSTFAQALASDDYEAARQAVTRACGSWAGAYALLLPTERGTDIASHWLDVLSESSIDHTYTGDVIDTPEPGQRHPAGGGLWMDGQGRGDLLLSILARSPQADRGWRDVQIADGVSTDDPWSLAYTTILGGLPESVERDDLRRHSLRDGLAYGDLLTLRRVEGGPGAEDLLARLRANDTVTAVNISTVMLSRAGAPLGRQWDSDVILEHRWQLAMDVGPNVVVVYEPGSVADLALLWHLRAVHAQPPGLPLAVPATVDVTSALRVWERERAMRLWGFRGPQCVLTSFSVPLADLEAMAAGTSHFKAVRPEPLMRPSLGCGLPSSEIAYFDNGKAALAPFSPTDHSTLGTSVIDEHGGWMRLRVVVPGRRLPDSRTMSADAFQRSFHEGAEVPVSTRSESVTVGYPSGMDALLAVLQDHGLRAERSAPGLAAEQFCRVIGGVDGLVYFGSPAVLAAVRLLARRSGMSTLRRRLNAFLGVTDAGPSQDQRIATLERRLDEALKTPALDDLAGVSLHQLRTTFRDAKAAEGWLRWAVDKRLVLRGITARCGACGLRQWRQLPETLPVLVCQGCGVDVREPFGLDAAHFSYRASHLLLRMLDADVLAHLLVLRFFARLFDGFSGSDGLVYGGYPGVEVRRLGDKSVLAEFDVVLVLADGRLILGECKTSARGLNEDSLKRLWALADEIGAAMTFVATLDRASDCPPVWRVGDGRKHVSLTAEHLFDISPVSLLNGPEPLDWREGFMSHSGSRLSDDEFNDQTNGLIKRLATDTNWWSRPAWRWDDDSSCCSHIGVAPGGRFAAG
jgi:hypothetical protein